MKRWNFSKAMIALVILGLNLNAFAAYNITDRFVLLEDKYKTTEMLTPLGHDFLIDIHAWMSSNIMDLVSDADDASKQSSTSDQLTAAVALMNKYNNTEQNVRIALNLGIPIFSFTAFGLKITPDIRAGGNVGVFTKIGTENCTTDTILSIISGQGLPESTITNIKSSIGSVSCSTIQNYSDSQGRTGNIAAYAISQGATATAELQAISDSGVASIPDSSTVPDLTNLPTLDIYVKGEAKAGLHLGYELEEDQGKGYLHLGILGRADLNNKISSASIANGADIADFGEEMNTTMAFTADFRYQYDQDDWNVFGEVQDLKLVTLSDNKATAGELIYTIDPLLRLHANYNMEFVGFKLNPFAGVHKRSQYDFADGVYAGADLSFYVWGERLGIRLRGMVDQEYFTFSPLLKLWVAHLDAGIKLPIKADTDGIKLSSIYHANFRLFF